MKILKHILTLCALLLATQAVHAQYVSKDITGYRYDQFSSSDVASIDLYTGRSTHFAILVFLPVDVSQLPSASLGSDGKYRLYYTRERLTDVIDQLRHESPLRMNYWTGHPSVDNSHIGTKSVELVGEGE